MATVNVGYFITDGSAAATLTIPDSTVSDWYLFVECQGRIGYVLLQFT